MVPKSNNDNVDDANVVNYNNKNKITNNCNNNNTNNLSKEIVPNTNLKNVNGSIKTSTATTTTHSVPNNTKAKKRNGELLSLFSFGKKKQSQKVNQSLSNAKSEETNKIPSKYTPLVSKTMANTTSKHGDSSETPSTADAKQKNAKTLTQPTILPCHITPVPIGTPTRQRKFVKSSSITRLLGNTYNAKKFEKDEAKRTGTVAGSGKFNTFGGRRRTQGPYLERFKRYSKEDSDVASIDSNDSNENSATNSTVILTKDSRDLHGGSHSELAGVETMLTPIYHEDLGSKAMRTLSRGFGKLLWKRTHSVDISTPDPEYKVSYLGNVLTGWAKGEGCVEKQLTTLWRNYSQNTKPDVIMRVKVCASGLKATTRQHGLTEYWANRITYCCAPANFPRVFCWIYRHEGRKLKHELRCHAVLCSKDKIAQDICSTLKDNLESALREFKREKILKQNARLSLANAAYDNPSLPRRKILLSVGGNNYRPPLERSKSAPKLMAIEEAIGEEDGEEIEETNEPEMKPCCQKDSLYPAMTLGRRHCRRGHSIRRTGKIRTRFCSEPSPNGQPTTTKCCSTETTKEIKSNPVKYDIGIDQRISYGSDDSDDFEKILKYNNYDSNVSLENELLPYFDLQLHKNTSQSLGSLSELKDSEEPLSMLPTINSDPSADPDADYDATQQIFHNESDDEQIVGLRQNGVCSDGEEDYLVGDELYFRQASILNMLHRNSMRKMANISMSSDESSIETNSSTHTQDHHHHHHQPQSSISSSASSNITSVSAAETRDLTATSGRMKQHNPDSDEGSISSGCDTASIVTANQDDLSWKYRQAMITSKKLQNTEDLIACEKDERLHCHLAAEPITAEEIYECLESRLQDRHNSDATTFSSSSSITLKQGISPVGSVNSGLDSKETISTTPSNATKTRRIRRQSATQQKTQYAGTAGDSDSSECSDESGYVEYQERAKVNKSSVVHEVVAKLERAKPQPPPKPMPRKQLGQLQKSTSTTV